MSTLLVIGAAQSFFFAILLIWKKNRTLCDKVLAMWLATLFIHLIITYCKYLELFEEFPHLIGTTSSLIFLYGPLLFFYVDNYISNFPGFRKIYLAHLIPFVAYNFYKMPFYLQSGQEKLAHYHSDAAGHTSLEVLFYLMKIVSIPTYVIWILYLLRKHRTNLKYYFSNLDNKDLEWVRYLIWSIAAVGVFIILAGIGRMKLTSLVLQNTDQYVLAVTSIWVFGLGFYAIRQTAIFQGVTFQNGGPTRKVTDQESLTEYKKNRLKQFEEDNLKVKLEEYIDSEKPFLQSRLTIDDLADNLQLPVHELSLFINESLNQNFHDLINAYRVKEFKSNLKDPANKNFTLVGIAMSCGFNSKASMNRIFKKHTGTTPSAYLRAEDLHHYK